MLLKNKNSRQVFFILKILYEISNTTINNFNSFEDKVMTENKVVFISPQLLLNS
jgi:hypothetical protein